MAQLTQCPSENSRALSLTFNSAIGWSEARKLPTGILLLTLGAKETTK